MPVPQQKSAEDAGFGMEDCLKSSNYQHKEK